MLLSASVFIQHWEVNQRWLEDAAIRIVCVLALDRFADFVSDQVSSIDLFLLPVQWTL